MKKKKKKEKSLDKEKQEKFLKRGYHYKCKKDLEKKKNVKSLKGPSSNYLKSNNINSTGFDNSYRKSKLKNILDSGKSPNHNFFMTTGSRDKGIVKKELKNNPIESLAVQQINTRSRNRSKVTGNQNPVPDDEIAMKPKFYKKKKQK